jgi:predicted RNA-binding Zn ribbon-like protein
LALVQAFVNTVDLEPHREELRAPEELHAWLAGHGLVESDARLSDADLSRALQVREALRALLEGNNGAPSDPEPVATLNSAARDACLQPRFEFDDEPHLEAVAPGVDGALGRLLAIVYSAMTDGTWERLKACRSGTCRWAFYDQSKNHSSAWCNMATCGSRLKARAYRQRRRAASVTA